jgi:hypothetical protein
MKNMYIYLAIFLGVFLGSCGPSLPDDALILENTMTRIEAVRPRGELYVLSALLEDFDSEILEGTFANHYAVQVVKARCSYLLDLEKVSYKPEISAAGPIIKVTMPAPKVYCSTQKTPFYSDDEAFWAGQRSSAANDKIKGFVASRIRQTFDSAENRQKAREYGQKVIAKTLELLGIKAEFAE